MDARRISQQHLADRIGCSQPAISQMLSRQSRPQKKTILKLADALGVDPRELWPDWETADMLDAVADFQSSEHIMTEAESHALGEHATRNRPRLSGQRLPQRRR